MDKTELKKLVTNECLIKDILGESLFKKLSENGKDFKTAIDVLHREMDRIAA